VPAPGILVSLHPGPVEQRKAAMRRFDGQGVAGPLVSVPLSLQVYLETLDLVRSPLADHLPLQLLELQVRSDGDPLCANEHKACVGIGDTSMELHGGRQW
jgi:hypothetical protein